MELSILLAVLFAVLPGGALCVLGVIATGERPLIGLASVCFGAASLCGTLSLVMAVTS